MGEGGGFPQPSSLIRGGSYEVGKALGLGHYQRRAHVN